MAKKEKLTELQQIGTNVRKLREAADISRAQLAFEIGSTEKQLARIEYGEINSGIMNYIKIARILNADLKDIFNKVKL